MKDEFILRLLKEKNFMASIPTISKSNINQFFNQKTIPSRALSAGQIITFNYTSPDGVRDRSPLIYVLEVRGDRVYGLNMHYDMSVLNDAARNKASELESYKKPSNKGKLILSKLPKLGKELPDGEEQETEIDEDVFETFSVNGQETKILRNYLMSRISGAKQLIWKKK